MPESEFSGLRLPKEAQGLVPFDVPTDRTRANRHYAALGRSLMGELSESVVIADDPVLVAKLRVGMDWIASRSTVASEFGRMTEDDNPTSEEVERLHKTIAHIAKRRPKITASEAAAYVRHRRIRESRKKIPRRDRIAALHHELNRVINEHRQRHPDTTWADANKALEYTVGQIARKTA
jgi:hypothetical protein